MNNLILGQSKLGKAVFANKNFKKDEEIIEFRGKLLKRRNLPKLVKPEDDRYIQVGKDEYLGPSKSYDDFFNHSCNPNSGIKIIKRKVVLITIKNIKRGKEITWDYSTTMDEDEWEMDCLCNEKNCRKRIKDFKYLPKKIKQKYIKLKIVPKYVLENLK
jgi:hypothetical protein